MLVNLTRHLLSSPPLISFPSSKTFTILTTASLSPFPPKRPLHYCHHLPFAQSHSASCYTLPSFPSSKMASSPPPPHPATPQLLNPLLSLLTSLTSFHNYLHLPLLLPFPISLLPAVLLPPFPLNNAAPLLSVTLLSLLPKVPGNFTPFSLYFYPSH